MHVGFPEIWLPEKRWVRLPFSFAPFLVLRVRRETGYTGGKQSKTKHWSPVTLCAVQEISS